jgi:hypothetical protein
MSLSQEDHTPNRIIRLIQITELVVRFTGIPLAITALVITALEWKSGRDLMLFLIAVSRPKLIPSALPNFTSNQDMRLNSLQSD